MSEDYLTREDRQWLRAHGWTPPSLRPTWDEGAEEMVAACPDCGQRISFAYDEVFLFDQAEPIKRIPTHVDLVTKAHARKCEARL